MQALAEEKTVYERSSSRTVYLNVAVNTIKRLRNEVSISQAAGSPNTSPSGIKEPKVLHQPTLGGGKSMLHQGMLGGPKVISHQAMLGGSKAASTSFTINRCGKNMNFTPDQLKGNVQ